jgi:hypothetical protein
MYIGYLTTLIDNITLVEVITFSAKFTFKIDETKF